MVDARLVVGGGGVEGGLKRMIMASLAGTRERERERENLFWEGAGGEGEVVPPSLYGRRVISLGESSAACEGEEGRGREREGKGREGKGK